MKSCYYDYSQYLIFIKRLNTLALISDLGSLLVTVCNVYILVNKFLNYDVLTVQCDDIRGRNE